MQSILAKFKTYTLVHLKIIYLINTIYRQVAKTKKTNNRTCKRIKTKNKIKNLMDNGATQLV